MSGWKGPVLAGALALAACGGDDVAPPSGAEPAEGAVLQGPAGAPAAADALEGYATKADLGAAAASYQGMLSWDEAAGLLQADALPTEAELLALLRTEDLAALDAALSEEEADALLVPKDLVPDPSQLMPKDEAAKTFVLAATAPDWSQYVLKQNLWPEDTWLTKEQAAALYAPADAVSAAHYSQTAAGQVFQSPWEPLSPELSAAVQAVVEEALAERPCPDGMVAVGDVCVDRYEASAWTQPGCQGTQLGAGDADDYPPTFPDTGAGALPVYACSAPGVGPSAWITWFQAERACAAVGKRLCTLGEWQAAAVGTPDGEPCHVDPFAGQASHIAEGTGCVSAWGASDMVGNVAEWTSSLRVAGKKWVQPGDQKATPWPAGIGESDGTVGVNGAASLEADDGNFTKGAPVAVVRGGSWLDGEAAGVYAMDWSRSPADRAATVGFRCCRSR